METTSPTQTETPPTASPDSSGTAPPMSVWGTILGVFTKPAATFRALAQKPRILVPMLLLVVVQIAFAVALMQTDVIKNDAVAKMEAKGTPPEQIEAMERVLDSPAKYFFVLGGPIAQTFILLLSAALLYFIANLMMGGKLRYAHYLSVVAYGGIIAVVDQLVRLGLAVQRGTLDVRLGVGAFMGDDLAGPLRVLDALTDPLFLWAAAIQALGIAVMARKPFRFGVIAILPVYVILGSLAGLQR